MGRGPRGGRRAVHDDRRLADETLRLQEYSPVFDAERFVAHERFFVEDACRWARSRFGVASYSSQTRSAQERVRLGSANRRQPPPIIGLVAVTAQESDRAAVGVAARPRASSAC